MELEYRSTTMVLEFPACMFLSTQLVTDVKELKFGWQGITSFESCHRGISPFSVPSSSLEVHQRLRALEEDAELATTTLADIRATRTRSPTCPGDYYSLLQMLCSYIKLLMMMFGTACEHVTSATPIFFLLQERMATFHVMTRDQVAHLLWAISIDARAYFNTPHDIMENPPVSSLDRLIGAMIKGAPCHLPSAHQLHLYSGPPTVPATPTSWKV